MPCKPEILRQVPLFALLDDDELAVLAAQVELKTYAPRERIYKIGEPGARAYVVVSGALARFLDRMHPDWNISLFHYRNHGADYGRILVGIQVPLNELGLLQDFLSTLGYPHVDESDNPAYRLLLRE